MTDSNILSDSELKINLKRKHEKVACRFSEQSLNKKRREVSPKKIDVNDYCLAELFMYIPIYERPKMAVGMIFFNTSII